MFYDKIYFLFKLHIDNKNETVTDFTKLLEDTVTGTTRTYQHREIIQMSNSIQNIYKQNKTINNAKTLFQYPVLVTKDFGS